MSWQASCLGDIALPRNHGLSHPTHVGPSNVLRSRHLAVLNDSIPWVHPTALELAITEETLFVLLIYRVLGPDLLLTLHLPFVQFFSRLQLPHLLLLILSHLSLIQLLLSLLLSFLDLCNSFLLLVIQIIFLLKSSPR